MKIYYREGYKYQLDRQFTHYVGIDGICVTRFLILSRGYLIISAGYAWDGPSGPSIDTDCFMRGSLVHDALYQLIRDGYLDKKYRETADNLLYDICMEDGMIRARAFYVYKAVRLFGGSHIGKGKPVLEAGSGG